MPATLDRPIIIDTSEQSPWDFPGERIINRSLDTGDYSVAGFEDVVTVERKSLPDLVNTVVGDWQRFSRQLRRMAAMDLAVIICEAPVTSLFEKRYSGDTNPLSVRGKLNRCLLDFGVPVMFLDNREIAAQWTLNLFQLFLERRGVTRPWTPLTK